METKQRLRGEELLKFFEAKASSHFTGTLLFKSSQGFAEVNLVQGRLLYAFRPLERMHERFLRIRWLETPPRSSWGESSEWLDYARPLLEANHFQITRVIQFLKKERIEILLRIFFWKSAEVEEKPSTELADLAEDFQFYKTEDLAPLLKEAIRRKNAFEVWKSRFEFPQEVWMIREPQPPITAEQKLIFDLVDGRRSIEKIVEDSEESEFVTLETLNFLLDRKWIAPRSEDRTPTVSLIKNLGRITLETSIGIITLWWLFQMVAPSSSWIPKISSLSESQEKILNSLQN